MLEKNDMVLSRTSAQGQGDTSASELKLPLRLSGESLKKALLINRLSVAQFIVGSNAMVASTGPNLMASILCIANLTVSGTLPDSLFRLWPLPDGRTYGAPQDSIKVLPNEIWSRLCEVSELASIEFKKDSLAASALLEWEIGIGPLHPFYDACGRTSRGVSALVQDVSGEKSRTHRTRGEYFEEGKKGRQAFLEYYRHHS
jgi:hypothetical protein